jgi:hypothetical protein
MKKSIQIIVGIVGLVFSTAVAVQAQTGTFTTVTVSDSLQTGGSDTVTSGNGDVAFQVSTSTGVQSAAMNVSSATGTYSFAACHGTASGQAAFGTQAGVASGAQSTAFSLGVASGTNSFAIDYGDASGWGAFALGSSALATANYALALTPNVTAGSYSSLVFGQYNLNQNTTGGTPSLTAWVATDPIFEIGNGTSTTASDALVVYKNGNATVQGTLGVHTELRTAPGGDLSMGSFTAGTPP